MGGFNADLNSVDRLEMAKAHDNLGTSWRVYNHMN
jgi:hypothetical protein